MDVMEIAFTIVGVVTGLAVMVGAWNALAPLRAEPHEPGAWLSVMFAGLACLAVAAAGIVVADGGNGFAGTGNFALVGGSAIIGILGLTLIASAIAIYEPDRVASRDG
jgi:hypothetical protein